MARMASNTSRDPSNENVVIIDQVLAFGPIRPVIDFPKTQYREKQLRFQELYGSYDWLEYSVEKDAIFCFPCRIFGTIGEFLSICY